MRAPARLALYAASLVVVFAASYAVAGALVPDQPVRAGTIGEDSHGEH